MLAEAREHVGDAHTLANMARRQGINYKGNHSNTPWITAGWRVVLNQRVFQRVYDDGG
jgi:hypothetical protein